MSSGAGPGLSLYQQKLLAAGWQERQGAKRPTVYWCGLIVTGAVSGTLRDYQLDEHTAVSPRLMVGWMRDTALWLADHLSPRFETQQYAHGCPPGFMHVPDGFPHPAADLDEWAADWTAQADAMRHLSDGHPYSMTTHDAYSVYSLSARPIQPTPFLESWLDAGSYEYEYLAA
ncbi:hypothetical protein ACFU99_28470 [Streptomyces sp. NPDC057654]|uniref:hypothetical protein n=1 Tax=Streptomyces sp. NPDC057654 TaxID=3346196 RepID=UPI00369EBE2D